ncbi:LacI family DNA-binding transcriptional regulator [Paraburkholderia caballeronis]|uniref:Transcriptional regulator, LacI family n=1 Tax=Paraburkholderia caballeronis TaxID=416943 RepID=A0A1H7IZ12_9BURK|nr:LacI family DNA-binding transcriptional regulator [Paraburkholderia caballeronis]PXW27627.1 LacI family transcriptional regulator [Paraburkholderia caballeronis]PXX03101.1 LacI family transcriptional regulator [Paraburkholderia caballeronis]RAK03826.1 LacI family transcriptional regulator [Paraburkholderia caballeronis]SEC17069.1 transcriptional regulator, LacI family [Paraburkholderia caballeronis]SEK67751.1 transcriptional regulator, LacI family [Paraburkholderia caballeronis]
MTGGVVPRRATISDVAREAGTGKTSISRYLNGELNVLSPELRARIEAAIERLDYRPNQMARGLKRGRNRLIGLLIADLANPYSVEVLQGVEAACHALGYMPLICHAANEVEMERRYLQLLTTYRVEGVIVNALGVREATLRPVGSGGIPAVLIDRAVEGLDADVVGLDNAAAARLGTEHLLARGYDDIQFVVQPFEHVSSRRERAHAFRAALDAAPPARGGTLVLDLQDEDAVVRAFATLDERIADAARRGARCALFAANAPVALHVALHLKARYGVQWQQRVALLSVDDPDWAELAGITTIRQPTHEIGYRAVEFLNERIEGAAVAARVAAFAGELVVRASTGG